MADILKGKKQTVDVLNYASDRESVVESIVDFKSFVIDRIYDQTEKIKKDGDLFQGPIPVYADGEFLDQFLEPEKEFDNQKLKDMILQTARRILAEEPRIQDVARIAEQAIAVELDQLRSQKPDVHRIWEYYDNACTTATNKGWPDFGDLNYVTLHATCARHWLVTSEPFDQSISDFLHAHRTALDGDVVGDIRIPPNWWIDVTGFFNFDVFAPQRTVDDNNVTLTTLRQDFWAWDEFYVEQQMRECERANQLPELEGEPDLVDQVRRMRWTHIRKYPFRARAVSGLASIRPLMNYIMNYRRG